MKKFLLMLFTASALISCDIDDDGPQLVTVPAKVVETDLPEFFEQGETYEINITYLLPNECHFPGGIVAQRGSEMGNGRRDIYVYGLATVELGNTCEDPATSEEENELEKTAKFSLLVDEDEPYTFYLWSGTDEDGEEIFEEVEVPVGEEELEPTPQAQQ